MSRLQAGISLALLALTLSVYAQVRSHQYVNYDDPLTITLNPDLETESLGDAAHKAFRAHLRANWIPLTVLSLQLDRALWDGAPAGTLLTNAVLHALSSVVLFLALAAMTRATWLSAFIAAVFALHPLHVESVAWASARKDVLSGLFFMLLLAVWARYARRPSWRLYAGALLCLALGLLSKPILVTAPCVLLLLDYWPLERLDRRAWLEKIPMFGAVVLIGLVTVHVQRGAGAMTFGLTIPMSQRIMNAVDSYWAYVLTSLWPAGLSPYYVHPLGTLSVARVAVEAVALLGLTGLALAQGRARPYLLVGWLWFVGMLGPVIGLLQVGDQARADRYTYLPQIGLSIALVFAVAGLARPRRARTAAAVLAGLVVVALAAVSFVQVGNWRDTRALFEHALALDPDNSFAHRRLATLAMQERDFETAEYHYRRFYDLRPERARESLMRFHLAMGEMTSGEARLARYRAAVEVAPENPRARRLLGLELYFAQQYEEAAGQLEESIGRAASDDPGNAEAYSALAVIRYRQGRLGDALTAAREALRLAPDLTSNRARLAWWLATQGDDALRRPGEALEIAMPLLEGDGANDPVLRDIVAAALAANGQFQEAISHAEAAVRLADRLGKPRLAEGARSRLRLYRAGRPYREP